MPRKGKRRLCDADRCENESHWRCEQCKEFLCNNCFAKHEKNPDYKYSHNVDKAGDDEKFIVDVATYCDIHPDKRLKANCESCEEPLCDTCLVNGTHRRHNVEPTVADALDRLVPLHRNYCDILDRHFKELEKQAEELDKLERKTMDEKKKATLNQQLDDVFQKMTTYHTLKWYIMLVLEQSRDEFQLYELQNYVKELLRFYKVYVEKPFRSPTPTPPPTPPPEPEIIAPPSPPPPSPPPPKPKPTSRYSRLRRGTSGAVRRCTLESYFDVLNVRDYKWLQQCQVHVPGDGVSRMNVVNDQLWLPVRDMDCVRVLDPNSGALLTTIELPLKTKPNAIQQINEESIIMAAETGVYVIELDGTMSQKLHIGCFSDVQADGQYRFVCLDPLNSKALLFQCIGPGSKRNWKFEKCIRLKTDQNTSHLFSSAFMLDDSVVASGNDANSLSGVLHKYIPRHGKKSRSHEESDTCFRRPIICGLDTKGLVLVADTWQDKIFLVWPDFEMKPITLHNQKKIPGPKDVLFLSYDTMWVLVEEALGKTLLMKYRRVENEELELLGEDDGVTLTEPEQRRYMERSHYLPASRATVHDAYHF